MSLTHIDLPLARQLERAEATANAAFVDARARIDNTIGATWINIANAYAMFDGIGSPLSQTFSVGLYEPFGAEEFDQLEAFYDARDASTVVEISTFASSDVVHLLKERGYAPIEHSTVLLRETLVLPDEHEGAITVRLIVTDELDRWAQISSLGWSSESAELGAFIEQLSLVMAHAHGTHCFLAELDARPIAAATLHVSNDVALFAGASTIPEARGRGAQRALLHARLAYAATCGAHLAMIVTQPSSASQRNAERAGFRPVYARTKWERGVSAHGE